MIWEILFPLFIIMYWACEGVTEGYTFASAKRKIENKLIHPNNGSNGIMDYHAWRIFENLGIWGTVFSAFLMVTSLKSFILLGVGSWLIGTFCYEAIMFIMIRFGNQLIISGTYLDTIYLGLVERSL